MPSRLTTTLSSIYSYVRTKTGASYTWALAHKVWATVIAVAVIGGGYFTYTHYFATPAGTTYTLATATKGPITVTVSGSGQVAANQELDLSPKQSGEITYVGVKAGQEVAAGTVVARVDATDAANALRDALASLESAQIAYAQSTANTSASESKTLDTAFTAATNVTGDLPQVVKDLDSALHDSTNIPGYVPRENEDAYAAIVGGAAGTELSAQAESSYQAALSDYKKLLALSPNVSPTSSASDIQNFIETAYTATQSAAKAVNDLRSLTTMVNDRLVRGGTLIPTAFTTILSNMTADASKTSSDASSALSARDALASSLQSLGGSGGTPLDIQSAQLTLRKAQNAVTDARTKLADYTVVAPFSGTIAKVNLQTHDQAGGSTPVATLVTNEQYAQLSLNEVDAAKVKAGQKAELTFDAIDGLTLTGTIAEIDSVGTVSQGVVTYDVKISFDSQDARVRPGMTVNAVITTDSKDSALLVPSSAVQTMGGRSFVEVVTAGAPAMPAAVSGTSTNRARTGTSTFAGGFGSTSARFRTSSTTANFAAEAALRNTETVAASAVTVTRVPVDTGLTNDTETEIVSGITEGTVVVSRTTTAAAATAASATTRTGTTGAAGGARGGNVLFRGG
jgi:HlyD family secretion protein